MEYTLETPLGELFAVDPAIDAPAKTGDEVSVQLSVRGVTLVRS